MKINERTIDCRNLPDYKYSKRIKPFTIASIEFCYETDARDKKLLDEIFNKGGELAIKVNPAAANHGNEARSKSTIFNNAAAGLLAEFAWKKYVNSKAGGKIVDYTEFVDAAKQIDLTTLIDGKLIEVRSSFPRNGIQFAICHQNYQFDILGPYSNTVKPGEVQKDIYVRALFHIPKGEHFINLAKKDKFKIYLTGGATWEMMTNDDISENKALLPEDSLVVQEEKSTYKVVPFSKALDSVEIYDLICQIEGQ